ncbi:MAG: Gfo/Idh/MocA family oxidoreductase [Lachnospiraceae bacterium]|nr:Gfo/Idh/MocA family oxidoreductase [Lachnospiraceae bacterium]
MENTVSTVIIGAGDIALKRHIPAILQAPNGTLAGFYNRHYERTRERAEQYGGHAYESYQEIWDDKAVDAVLISTPPAAHAEIAIAAMKAGKHVLLEKPMTLSVKEAEDIADAAVKYGRKLMLLHIQRFYVTGNHGS